MRLRVVLVLLSAVTVVVVTAAAWLHERQQTLQALQHQAVESLSLRSSGVLAEIERDGYQPFVPGRDERIRRLPSAESDQGLADVADRYLGTVNGPAGSSDLFVLNAAGTAPASSNPRAGLDFRRMVRNVSWKEGVLYLAP